MLVAKKKSAGESKRRRSEWEKGRKRRREKIAGIKDYAILLGCGGKIQGKKYELLKERERGMKRNEKE